MEIKLEKYTKATEAEIAKTEKKLGLSLPKDYRDFVLKYNGAIPEENVFGDNLLVSVDGFIPISDVATRAGFVDGFPSDAFPVAESPSGNFIYIRKGSFDVFFWDHEVDDDKRLATSFSEFIDGLTPFDIDTIQLKPDQVKSVWVDPDFKPEF